MAAFQAGQLDRRAQVLRAVSVDDGLQRRRGEFEPFGPLLWVGKRDIADAERFAAGSVRAVITTRFRLRWSPFSAGIRTTDRLECEGEVYEIVGIKEIGRRDLIEITGKAAS